MMIRHTSRIAIIAFLIAAATNTAEAQGWSYPSFQPPRLTVREYNFGMADASGPGTSLLFQWREQSGPRHLFSFDVGIADPDFDQDIVAFGGVGYGLMLGQETEEVPLAFMFTAGAHLAIGDDTRLRFPVGLSMGHEFEFEGGVALMPYIHPRLTIDLCNGCGGSDVGVSFDLGANLELTRSISLRFSTLFTGNESIDDEGFGISIAWTPPSLLRRGR
jgi:hypothetical protein